MARAFAAGALAVVAFAAFSAFGGCSGCNTAALSCRTDVDCPTGTRCGGDGVCSATPLDAGVDAGQPVDAGGVVDDAGAADAGAQVSSDAGPSDAGPSDAGPSDAGRSQDAGAVIQSDAGVVVDGGPPTCGDAGVVVGTELMFDDFSRVLVDDFGTPSDPLQAGNWTCFFDTLAGAAFPVDGARGHIRWQAPGTFAACAMTNIDVRAVTVDVIVQLVPGGVEPFFVEVGGRADNVDNGHDTDVELDLDNNGVGMRARSTDGSDLQDLDQPVALPDLGRGDLIEVRLTISDATDGSGNTHVEGTAWAAGTCEPLPQIEASTVGNTIARGYANRSGTVVVGGFSQNGADVLLIDDVDVRSP